MTLNPVEIFPEELTPEGFAPYGKAILPLQRPAPRSGDDWDCWFGVGDLGGSEPVAGIVLTRPPQGAIEWMEREPTVEFLLPITGPIVQAVGIPGDLNNHNEQPDVATVRAFIVKPGQAIAMAPGTWHYAALPLGKEEVLYYYFLEPHLPEPGHEDNPWIRFKHRRSIRVKLPE
jgi:ureidoglycolate lyase